jgi:hypothetical protein
MKHLKALAVAATIWACLVQPTYAAIETGQTQLLQIEAWYQSTASGSIYIQFKLNGAMPGCYGTRGGYLSYTEANFDRHYATFMTLLAKGSINGAVLFEKTGADPAVSWGACNIKGLYLQPQ